MSQTDLKPLLILQTGQAPEPIRALHGNFPQMFIRQGNMDSQQVVIVDLQAGERPQPPQNYAGAVITGSRSMVTEHLDWSEYAADWIRQAMLIDLPMLGACYGHQLMAYALGVRSVIILRGSKSVPKRSSYCPRRQKILWSLRYLLTSAPT